MQPTKHALDVALRPFVLHAPPNYTLYKSHTLLPLHNDLSTVDELISYVLPVP
jgi:hypothetical protein